MRPLRPLSRASLNEPATGLRREGRAGNQRLLAGRPRRLNGHAQPPGRMRLPGPRQSAERAQRRRPGSVRGREGDREEGRAAAAAGAGAARGSVGRAGGGAPRRGAA